jgi:hypothetical protein
VENASTNGTAWRVGNRKEPPIQLRVELPCAEVGKKSAVLKDRLAYLLDTRFRPANAEPLQKPKLTVTNVAELLHCRCVTVLLMIKRGQLHPFNGDDDELYFDPEEVAGVRHVPLNRILSRLIPPN